MNVTTEVRRSPRPHEACPQCESLARLTRRQRQVAGLVSTGETNRDVALRLGISINTVKKYLKLAFAELDIANRTELAAFLGHRCTGSDVVA